MSFTDIILFGEMGSIIQDKASINCTLTNMFLENTINLDGTINIMVKFDQVRKRDLWTYIYYICKYNPKLGIELTEKDFKEKIANDKPFVRKQHLANFINTTLNANNDIKIDFILSLLKSVRKQLNVQENLIDNAINEIPEINELEEKLMKVNRLMDLPRNHHLN